MSILVTQCKLSLGALPREALSVSICLAGVRDSKKSEEDHIKTDLPSTSTHGYMLSQRVSIRGMYNPVLLICVL
jgi:hypothetical protein